MYVWIYACIYVCVYIYKVFLFNGYVIFIKQNKNTFVTITNIDKVRFIDKIEILSYLIAPITQNHARIISLL